MHVSFLQYYGVMCIMKLCMQALVVLLLYYRITQLLYCIKYYSTVHDCIINVLSFVPVDILMYVCTLQEFYNYYNKYELYNITLYITII